MDYFEDCINHNVKEEARETINRLYNLLVKKGKEDFPKKLYTVSLSNINDLTIHLMSEINTRVWEAIAKEDDKYKNYSTGRTANFSPIVKLESGYILFLNEIDDFIKDAEDVHAIIQSIVNFFEDDFDEETPESLDELLEE